jgi:hypothetical protein
MGGMQSERRKSLRFLPVLIVLTVLAVALIPVVLIGCAVLEDALFGTNYLEQVAQVTGTHAAFGKLYEALQPILGW